MAPTVFTETEFKRNTRDNEDGLLSLKRVSSTIKLVGETLHRKKLFDAEKKFKELLHERVSKLMRNVKLDDVDNAMSSLQTLSSILSDNEDLRSEISFFLSENKFPETLASQVRDALSGKYGDDFSWSYLSEIFNVVNTLVNDDHKGPFVKSMVDQDFTHLIQKFLRHPKVLDNYQKNPVLTRTVVSALDVLIIIFMQPSTINAKELIDTFGAYLQSSNNDVRMLVNKGTFELSKVLFSNVAERQDLDIRINLQLHSQLPQKLLLCTKHETFLSMMLNGNNENEWKDLVSTVVSLSVFSKKSVDFIEEICSKGVIGTICNILNNTEIIAHADKSQKVNIVIVNLLLVLLRVTVTTDGKRQLLRLDASTTASTLLNSKVSSQVKGLAVALVSILSDKSKSEQSLPSIDTKPEIIDVIADMAFAPEFFTVQLESKISDFLLGTGFSSKLCTELYDMVNIDGRIIIPEQNNNYFELFCKYIRAFANRSINSKEWLGIMVEVGIVDILKAVLCSKLLLKSRKTMKDAEILILITNAVQILNALAHHGFRANSQSSDRTVVDQLYTLALSPAQDKHSELLQLYSKSFFVLTSESNQEQMPTFIDKKDIKGSIRFIDFFIQTYRGLKALSLLNNSLCEKGVLNFVASTIRDMINSNPASLPPLIYENEEKFVLLYKLVECAGSNKCLFQEFSQSGYMRLFHRLLSDGDIRQTYISEEVQGQQKINTLFLDFNIKTVLALSKTEENVSLLSTPNVIPEMLFFASGTMINREASGIVGHVWNILARVWLAYGCKWPDGCKISSRMLTDCIICPNTLPIIMSVMLDNATENRVKTAVLEMVDKDTLAIKICKAIGSQISEIRIHSDDTVNKNLSILLDCLYVFGQKCPYFHNIVEKKPEYTMLIDKVLGECTDPQVTEVDKIAIEYCKRSLRLILLTVQYNIANNRTTDQHHFDLITKWLTCCIPLIQMLALSALSLLPFEPPVQTCIDQIPRLVCKNDLIFILKNFAFTQSSLAVDIQPIENDMSLRVLLLLARDKSRRAEILSWFHRSVIGDLIESLVKHKLTSTSQWQDDALNYAVSLVWLLSLNRLNIKRLSGDPALVGALKQVAHEENGAVGNGAFCCLLEITGEVPEHKVTVKEKYDAAVIGPEALETLSSGIDEALKVDGYRVVKATFSQAGHRIIDVIHNSQFVIYLFNQETEYSAMCHTAVNQAHRTNTPFIGIYVGDKDGWGNWPISPQNRVHIIANTGHGQISEMLRNIRQRIPRVNLCLNPYLPTDDDLFMADFNTFVTECEVGDKYFAENFVGSVFDSNGGYLMLPSQEVVLYVPPGAIEEGKRQPVYCHGNEYMYGGINACKIALSPIVHCGPDGAEFKRDVVLTFPHCAVNPNNWKFTALTRAKEGSWNKLPENTTIVKDEFVYVFLDHFTGFTAEGEAKEGKTARRRIIIDARGCFSRGTSCQVQVGAWCDTGSRSEDRKIQDISASWKQRNALTVGDQDKFLITEIKYVEEGWQQRGSSKPRIIRLADLGTDKDPDVTNCRFTFRHILSNKEKPEDFYCTVSVTTEGQENTELELVIPNTEAETISSESDSNWAEMTNAESYRKLNEDWNPKDNRVGEDLWRSLCQVLDVPRDGIKDWKGFAEKLDLEAGQINTLQVKESPTNRLLAFFFTIELKRGKKLDKSLETLMSIFGEMENEAAKTYVSNYMEKERMRDP